MDRMDRMIEACLGPEEPPVITDEDPLPYEKNGWKGHITNHRGIPVGTLILRARKGQRWIMTPPMTAEQIVALDPDEWWNRGLKGKL